MSGDPVTGGPLVRLARRLLERSLPPGSTRDGLLGDLEELYAERRRSDGGLAAGLWYVWQALFASVRLHRWVRRAGFLRRDRGARPSARAGVDGVSAGRRVSGTGLTGLLSGPGGVRLAVRRIVRTPLFSAAVIATLALGIGGATSIFSVVRGILLRPLPYDDPDGLVMVWAELLHEGTPRWSVTPDNYDDLRERSGVLRDAAAQLGWGYTMTGAGDPVFIRSARVTGNFFRVLGAAPALGRTLLPSDDEGPARVAVLSHALWHGRFGGDADVLGRTIRLAGEPYEVVGVMPPDFYAPTFYRAPHQPAELWIPLDLPPEWDNRAAAVLQVVGRLRNGVTVERAWSEMRALGERLAEEHPQNEGVGVNVVPLYEQIVGGTRPVLLALSGGVALLLLIACANVASLLLSRALGRRSEVAVQAALGASRGRLVAQLLVESLVLAAAGGGLGVLLAYVGTDALTALAPAETPRLDAVAVDLRVLGFAALLTVGTGLGLGLVPSLRGTRFDIRAALAAGGRSVAGVRSRIPDGLVVAQVALALVLLAGSGLMVRTLAELHAVDLGFRTRDVLTFRMSIPATRYADTDAHIRFQEELVRALDALPEVRTAGTISRLPLDPAFGMAPMNVEGVAVARAERPVVGIRTVGGRYFESLDIPLLAGRGFSAADDADAPAVALVNRTLARRTWPESDAVGRRIGLGAPGAPWIEVVGVVGAVAHDGVRAEAIPEVYLPVRQNPQTGFSVVARTVDDPVAAVPAARRAVHALDPALALLDVRSMEGRVADSVAVPRFSTVLLGAFAALALILAAMGLYAVLAYAVTRRRHELGIRLALGATPGDIRRLILRRGLLLTGAGLALGLAGAIGATRLLRTMLFGVAPGDPATLAATALLLLAVAAGGWLIPANRAAGVDPVRTLQSAP